MKPNEINVGVTYHNGKVGPRSYAARKVLEMGVEVQHYDMEHTTSNSGIRFLQTVGRYAGKEFVIPLDSFAKWAKGEAGPAVN